MIIIITLSYMSSIMNLLSIDFLPRRSLSGSSWRGSDMIDSFVNYIGVGNARCCSSWKSKPLNHKNIKHKHLHKHIFYSHYGNDRGQEVKCILYKKTGLRFDVIFCQNLKLKHTAFKHSIQYNLLLFQDLSIDIDINISILPSMFSHDLSSNLYYKSHLDRQ